MAWTNVFHGEGGLFINAEFKITAGQKLDVIGRPVKGMSRVQGKSLQTGEERCLFEAHHQV